MTQRYSLFAVIRVPLGLVLVAVGGVLSLPLVPGPGIPIMLVGFALLSKRFACARKIHIGLRNAASRLRKGVRSGEAQHGNEYRI